MKNVLISVLTTLLAFSCAGYFQDDPVIRDKSVQPLAIAGGGYLSSDTANDVTPFVFRDGGRAWLFFSSDRDGNYDIYYAELYENGRFSSPVKLLGQINTPTNEKYPVMTKSNSKYYLAFIRGISNVVMEMTGSFLPVSNIGVITYAFGNLGLFQHTNTNDTWYVVIEPSIMRMLGTPSFEGGAGNNPFIPGGLVCGNLYFENGINFMVFESNNRIYWATNYGLDIESFTPPFRIIPDYIPEDSSVKDASPFVDVPTKKVYFSSDRKKGNNFDLYRYNNMTFDKVMK